MYLYHIYSETECKLHVIKVISKKIWQVWWIMMTRVADPTVDILRQAAAISDICWDELVQHGGDLVMSIRRRRGLATNYKCVQMVCCFTVTELEKVILHVWQCIAMQSKSGNVCSTRVKCSSVTECSAMHLLAASQNILRVCTVTNSWSCFTLSMIVACNSQYSDHVRRCYPPTAVKNSISFILHSWVG